MCGKVIVMLDLCSKLHSLQTQTLVYKFVTESNPVMAGEGYVMRIEVTSRSSEFRCIRNISEQVNLVLQSLDKYHNLFTQRGRRCRLTMCFSQHRNLFPGAGHGTHCRHYIQQVRHVYFLHCFFP
ncbi:hypothetical protein D3C86_1489160 [compost metagenome]